MIPTETNSLGRNMNGIQDPEIDQWIKEAGASQDVKVRADRYCKILKKNYYDLAAEQWNGLLPNFQFSSPKVKGWTDGEQFVWFGSDSENWYLEK